MELTNRSLFIINLFETWVAQARGVGKKSDSILNIYCNPSRSDITEVTKAISPDNAVRLVVDTDKKVVYLASSELLHWAIASEMGIKKWSNLEGRIVGGKVVLSVYVGGYNLTGRSSVKAFDYYKDPDSALSTILYKY